MSARPLPGVNLKTAATGDGLLSMISQSFWMYRSLVCGNCARIATGTIAASSALFGVSSVTTLSPAAMGAPAKSSARSFCQTTLASGSLSWAQLGAGIASQSASTT
jgi:hypothetical protein